ncbi:leucine-rich repeat domain-containing protein [Shewanella sp. 0m-8]
MTSLKLTAGLLASSLLALSGCALTQAPKQVSEVQFTDPQFAQCVQQNGITELAKITQLSCNSQQITNVDEIRFMPALTALVLLDNQISHIDVSHLEQLDRLIVGNNQLTDIDLSNNPLLIALNISGNNITTVDVSENPQLISLYAYKLPLTQIDTSTLPKLRDLGLSRHQLTEIDLSHNPELQTLNLSVGTLSKIDLSHNPKLNHLYLPSNQLTALDLEHNPDLRVVAVRNNQLKQLDLSQNPRLIKVKADYNQIDDMTLSPAAPLIELELNNNRITELDISAFNKLNKLVAFNNPLQSLILDPQYHPKMLSIEGTPVSIANNALNQQDISNLLSPRVSIIEAGTITQNGAQYDVNSSQLVMPTLGQYIGYRYAVNLPKDASGKVDSHLAKQNQFPITVRMTHPKIVDPKSGKGFTTSSWTDTMFKHDRNLAMWYFGDAHELVTGRWTLEILYRDSVVSKKSFMLVNMDEKNVLKGGKNKAVEQALTLEKLITQGEYYLCNQDKYQRCLGFKDAKSCAIKLQPFKSQCLKDALTAVKQQSALPMNDQLKEFFSHYIACMGSQYITTTELDPQHVGSCLKR